jgi:hypothetical protein
MEEETPIPQIVRMDSNSKNGPSFCRRRDEDPRYSSAGPILLAFIIAEVDVDIAPEPEEHAGKRKKKKKKKKGK